MRCSARQSDTTCAEAAARSSLVRIPQVPPAAHAVRRSAGVPEGKQRRRAGRTAGARARLRPGVRAVQLARRLFSRGAHQLPVYHALHVWVGKLGARPNDAAPHPHSPARQTGRECACGSLRLLGAAGLAVCRWAGAPARRQPGCGRRRPLLFPPPSCLPACFSLACSPGLSRRGHVPHDGKAQTVDPRVQAAANAHTSARLLGSPGLALADRAPGSPLGGGAHHLLLLLHCCHGHRSATPCELTRPFLPQCKHTPAGTPSSHSAAGRTCRVPRRAGGAAWG